MNDYHGKMKTAVEKASEKLAQLDAAGYGIIILRCSHESDIRRVVASYQFGRKPGGNNRFEWEYKQESIMEATGIGTVLDFYSDFYWGSHGLNENYEVSYEKDSSLMSFLETCNIYPASMEHKLLYIPNISEIITGERGPGTLVQAQYIHLIKGMARLKRIGKCNALIVIGCTDGALCKELKEYYYVLDIEFPDQDEVAHIIEDACRNCDGGNFTLSRSNHNALTEIMRGFRRDEIYSIFNLAFATDEAPTFGNASALFRTAENAKRQKMTGIAGLKWLENKTPEVGGLKELKAWLESKRILFQHPHAAQIQKASHPKGILLCGLPGSGKTTLAQMAANMLGVGESSLPLLQLDISALLGKWVGESESNCDIALQTIESVAPCVLLLDEVEKIFGGVSSGHSHEVTMHLFTKILDWTQQTRKNPVFIIATANKTELLPPEFKRKGRFDETFFVGIPTYDDCSEIFRIYLEEKINQGIVDADLDDNNAELNGLIDEVLGEAAALERFLNGADIENIVAAAFGNLFSEYVRNMESFKDSAGKTLDWLDERNEVFYQYRFSEVKQGILTVLRSTRSYFDNNMHSTAEYWLDMVRQHFREAGKRQDEGEDVILPSEECAIDLNTGMFDVEYLARKHLITSDCQKADDLFKSLKGSQRNKKEEYIEWIEIQKEEARAKKDYNGAFRWSLAMTLCK